MRKLILEIIRKIMNIFSGYENVKFYPIKIVFNLLKPSLKSTFAVVGKQ